MRLTTKARYAVRALFCLSKYSKDKPTPLSVIAKDQDISLNFLEQLFVHLRKQGIVTSVRGPRGGYKLNRDPKDISIGEVLRAVGEPMYPVVSIEGTLGDSHKSLRVEEYMTNSLWMKLGDTITGFLDGTSLSELDTLKPH